MKAGTYKKDFFKLKITKKGPDFLEVFQFMKLSFWKIDTHNLTATSYLDKKISSSNLRPINNFEETIRRYFHP